MKREVADLWIEALLSGEYTQGQGALIEISRDTGETVGHCCLGVLCEVAKKNGVNVEFTPPVRKEFNDGFHGADVYYESPKFDNRDDLLPTSVKEWAGMKSDDGSLPVNDLISLATLAEKNDNGSTFGEIVEIIAENVEVL